MFNCAAEVVLKTWTPLYQTLYIVRLKFLFENDPRVNGGFGYQILHFTL